MQLDPTLLEHHDPTKHPALNPTEATTSVLEGRLGVEEAAQAIDRWAAGIIITETIRDACGNDVGRYDGPTLAKEAATYVRPEARRATYVEEVCKRWAGGRWTREDLQTHLLLLSDLLRPYVIATRDPEPLPELSAEQLSALDAGCRSETPERLKAWVASGMAPGDLNASGRTMRTATEAEYPWYATTKGVTNVNPSAIATLRNGCLQWVFTEEEKKTRLSSLGRMGISEAGTMKKWLSTYDAGKFLAQCVWDHSDSEVMNVKRIQRLCEDMPWMGYGVWEWVKRNTKIDVKQYQSGADNVASYYWHEPVNRSRLFHRNHLIDIAARYWTFEDPGRVVEPTKEEHLENHNRWVRTLKGSAALCLFDPSQNPEDRALWEGDNAEGLSESLFQRANDLAYECAMHKGLEEVEDRLRRYYPTNTLTLEREVHNQGGKLVPGITRWVIGKSGVGAFEINAPGGAKEFIRTASKLCDLIYEAETVKQHSLKTGDTEKATIYRGRSHAHAALLDKVFSLVENPDTWDNLVKFNKECAKHRIGGALPTIEYTPFAAGKFLAQMTLTLSNNPSNKNPVTSAQWAEGLRKCLEEHPEFAYGMGKGYEGEDKEPWGSFFHATARIADYQSEDELNGAPKKNISADDLLALWEKIGQESMCRPEEAGLAAFIGNDSSSEILGYLFSENLIAHRDQTRVRLSLEKLRGTARGKCLEAIGGLEKDLDTMGIVARPEDMTAETVKETTEHDPAKPFKVSEWDTLWPVIRSSLKEQVGVDVSVTLETPSDGGVVFVFNFTVKGAAVTCRLVCSKSGLEHLSNKALLEKVAALIVRANTEALKYARPTLIASNKDGIATSIRLAGEPLPTANNPCDEIALPGSGGVIEDRSKTGVGVDPKADLLNRLDAILANLDARYDEVDTEQGVHDLTKGLIGNKGQLIPLLSALAQLPTNADRKECGGRLNDATKRIRQLSEKAIRRVVPTDLKTKTAGSKHAVKTAYNPFVTDSSDDKDTAKEMVKGLNTDIGQYKEELQEAKVVGKVKSFGAKPAPVNEKFVRERQDRVVLTVSERRHLVEQSLAHVKLWEALSTFGKVTLDTKDGVMTFTSMTMPFSVTLPHHETTEGKTAATLAVTELLTECRTTGQVLQNIYADEGRVDTDYLLTQAEKFRKTWGDMGVRVFRSSISALDWGAHTSAKNRSALLVAFDGLIDTPEKGKPVFYKEHDFPRALLHHWLAVSTFSEIRAALWVLIHRVPCLKSNLLSNLRVRQGNACGTGEREFFGNLLATLEGTEPDGLVMERLRSTWGTDDVTYLTARTQEQLAPYQSLNGTPGQRYVPENEQTAAMTTGGALGYVLSEDNDKLLALLGDAPSPPKFIDLRRLIPGETQVVDNGNGGFAIQSHGGFYLDIGAGLQFDVKLALHKLQHYWSLRDRCFKAWTDYAKTPEEREPQGPPAYEVMRDIFMKDVQSSQDSINARVILGTLGIRDDERIGDDNKSHGLAACDAAAWYALTAFDTVIDTPYRGLPPHDANTWGLANTRAMRGPEGLPLLRALVQGCSQSDLDVVRKLMTDRLSYGEKKTPQTVLDYIAILRNPGDKAESYIHRCELVRSEAPKGLRDRWVNGFENTSEGYVNLPWPCDHFVLARRVLQCVVQAKVSDAERVTHLQRILEAHPNLGADMYEVVTTALGTRNTILGHDHLATINELLYGANLKSYIGGAKDGGKSYDMTDFGPIVAIILNSPEETARLEALRERDLERLVLADPHQATAKTPWEVAMDTLRSDAKDAAIRSTVGKVRDVVTDRLADFWARRTVTRATGESDHDYQGRVDTYRDTARGFLDSDMGRGLLSYVTGAVWSAVQLAQGADLDQETFATTVAHELRVQGGTQIAGGVVADLISAITEATPAIRLALPAPPAVVVAPREEHKTVADEVVVTEMVHNHR